jgi:hypothetical protein
MKVLPSAINDKIPQVRVADTLSLSMTLNRFVSLLGAVKALKEAIALDQDGGNFRAAARHYQEVAELYEGELDNAKGAYEAYSQASDLFLADDSPA